MAMTVLIIAGSRDIHAGVVEAIQDWIEEHGWPEVIIAGGARGVDSIAANFALADDIDLHVMHAQWDKYGKRAGYLRNKDMAENATHLLAIWDGESRGTKHMIDIAEEAGLDVTVVRR